MASKEKEKERLRGLARTSQKMRKGKQTNERVVCKKQQYSLIKIEQAETSNFIVDCKDVRKCVRFGNLSVVGGVRWDVVRVKPQAWGFI